MHQKVTEVIARMHMDFNKQQLGELELEAMIRSWSDHLKAAGVHPAEVKLIYSKAVKAKAAAGNPFMPNVSELIHEFYLMQADDFFDEETHEEYKPLPPGTPQLPGGIPVDSKAPKFVQQYHAWLRVTGEPVRCNCPEQHYGKVLLQRPVARLEITNWDAYFVCAEGKCDFKIEVRKLNNLLQLEKPIESPITPEDTPTTSKGQVPDINAATTEMAEISTQSDEHDDELMNMLREKCGFTEAKLQRQLKRHTLAEIKTFVRFFEFHTPVAEWTAAGASAAWKEYFNK